MYNNTKKCINPKSVDFSFIWLLCSVVKYTDHNNKRIMAFIIVYYYYLGKGEVLTNTDLDRFVKNIWEK